MIEYNIATGKIHMEARFNEMPAQDQLDLAQNLVKALLSGNLREEKKAALKAFLKDCIELL